VSETITIRLDFNERKFLLEIARRGGEMNMNTRSFSEDVNKSLNSLKDKECISIIDTQVLFEKRYRLTDIGRNLVAMIHKDIKHA
jgi:hypothetical protein